MNATAKAKAKGKANEKEAKVKAKEEKAKKKEAKGPGLKRLGSLWQGMCQPDLPPQTDAWPRPHHPDDDAVMLHCFLVKFYPAFGLCNSSWFYREP